MRKKPTKDGVKSLPGFAACMRMLRGQVGKPGLGNTPEDAFFALQSRAGQCAEGLIREFSNEDSPGVRFYLLELIAEAKSPKAFPVLFECLRGDETDLWVWAITGIQKLDSKEARTALWEARTYTKDTDELTAIFLEQLREYSE